MGRVGCVGLGMVLRVFVCLMEMRKDDGMIGALVTFGYGEEFDEQTLRRIAEGARAKFIGMSGLRSKAFTVNPRKRQAINFYVWDSKEAAEGFFTEAMLERVAGLYGVRPSVEFVEIAALVEGAARG